MDEESSSPNIQKVKKARKIRQPKVKQSADIKDIHISEDAPGLNQGVSPTLKADKANKAEQDNVLMPPPSQPTPSKSSQNQKGEELEFPDNEFLVDDFSICCFGTAEAVEVSFSSISNVGMLCEYYD